MNAMTRTYHSTAVGVSHLLSSRTQRKPWSWTTKCLIVLLVLSAFAVVYLKDLNRRLFIQYQDTVKLTQESQIEWGKLMLEQSTLAAQANVQQTAIARLNMVTPVAKEIVLLNNG